MVSGMEIMPLLTRADWPRRDVCLCRPLLAGVDDAPLVAFGIDTTTSTRFLPRRDLDTPARQAQVEAVAMRALRQRRESDDWDMGDTSIRSGSRPYVWRAGDAYTASDILDRPLMTKYERRLSGPPLYVGIPVRELMIIGTRADEVAALTAERYLEAIEQGLAGLCPHVFALRQGRVEAIALRHPVAKSTKGTRASGL